MTSPARGRAGPVLDFARTVIDLAGWRLLPAVLLPVALGLTEGAGVLLLLPLLARIGLDVEQGGAGQLAGWVEAAFAALGLPMTLPAVLGAFAVLMALNALAARVQATAYPTIDQQVLVHYREALYRAFLNARWPAIVRVRVNDLTHAVMTDVQRVSALTYQGLTLVSGAILTVIYLALATRLSASLTALVLGCGLLLLLLQRGSGARVTDAGQRTATSSGALHHLVAESLAGIKTTRSYGAEPRLLEIFGRLNDDVRRSYLDFIGAYAGTKFRFDLGAALLVSLVLLLAVEVLHLPAASLFIVLLLFARLIPRAAALHAAAQVFMAALPSFVRVHAMLRRFEAEAEAAPGMAAAPRLERRLEVRDVSLEYEGSNRAALDGITLAIPAGRTTAIVGPSGSGKSTLADLLMGLLTPTRGAILLDGEPLSAGRLAGWRTRVGYVPQETFLLNDTIRANLLWAVPGASDAELWRALDLAQAGAFTRRLPAELETSVGDRGVRLSGGERQRLALARALLRQPDLLILDEATSALDSEHERRIQESIDALHGRLTIVVITHRLSTVRRADAIHVIEDGRLVESGSWDSLVSRRDGRFRVLCEAQHVI